MNGSQPSSSPSLLELRLTSEPAQLAEARRRVEAFCITAGLNVRDAEDLGLCLNEALANIIRHAYRGMAGKPILVNAHCLNPSQAHGEGSRYPGPAVRVTIRDWGTGVNPAALPPKPRDPLQPGGVGLICLQSLLDEVSYTPQPDGMLLSMTRQRIESTPRGAVSGKTGSGD